MEHGIPRIRAARWVLALARLYWALLVLAACWSLLGAVFLWSPGALLVPLLLAAAATAWGAPVRAFEAHRRGAWQLLVAASAVPAAATVAAWAAGAAVIVPAVLSTVVDVVLLALLLHPDSRDWVALDEPGQRRTARVGGHPEGGH